MRTRWWLAGFGVALAAMGCSTGGTDEEEPTEAATFQLVVGEAGDAPPASELVILFNKGDAATTHWIPLAPPVIGDESGSFQVVLDPDGPPPGALHTDELDVFVGPDVPATRGHIYRTVPGATEAHPELVGALDNELITGMVDRAFVMYVAPPEGYSGPYAAGWHLIVNGADAPLDTPLQMGAELDEFF